MSLQASVSITVPALQDNAVWFQNAAAWTNYWQGVTANVEVTPIDNTIYAPVAYVESDPLILNIMGVSYTLVSTDMFNSLKNRVDALELSYRQLRTDLKDGGLLVNSQ